MNIKHFHGKQFLLILLGGYLVFQFSLVSKFGNLISRNLFVSHPQAVDTSPKGKLTAQLTQRITNPSFEQGNVFTSLTGKKIEGWDNIGNIKTEVVTEQTYVADGAKSVKVQAVKGEGILQEVTYSADMLLTLTMKVYPLKGGVDISLQDSASKTTLDTYKSNKKNEWEQVRLTIDPRIVSQRNTTYLRQALATMNKLDTSTRFVPPSNPKDIRFNIKITGDNDKDNEFYVDDIQVAPFTPIKADGQPNDISCNAAREGYDTCPLFLRCTGSVDGICALDPNWLYHMSPAQKEEVTKLFMKRGIEIVGIRDPSYLYTSLNGGGIEQMRTTPMMKLTEPITNGEEFTYTSLQQEEIMNGINATYPDLDTTTLLKIYNAVVNLTQEDQLHFMQQTNLEITIGLFNLFTLAMDMAPALGHITVSDLATAKATSALPAGTALPKAADFVNRPISVLASQPYRIQVASRALEDLAREVPAVAVRAPLEVVTKDTSVLLPEVADDAIGRVRIANAATVGSHTGQNTVVTSVNRYFHDVFTEMRQMLENIGITDSLEEGDFRISATHEEFQRLAQGRDLWGMYLPDVGEVWINPMLVSKPPNKLYKMANGLVFTMKEILKRTALHENLHHVAKMSGFTDGILRRFISRNFQSAVDEGITEYFTSRFSGYTYDGTYEAEVKTFRGFIDSVTEIMYSYEHGGAVPLSDSEFIQYRTERIEKLFLDNIYRRRAATESLELLYENAQASAFPQVPVNQNQLWNDLNMWFVNNFHEKSTNTTTDVVEEKASSQCCVDSWTPDPEDIHKALFFAGKVGSFSNQAEFVDTSFLGTMDLGAFIFAGSNRSGHLYTIGDIDAYNQHIDLHITSVPLHSFLTLPTTPTRILNPQMTPPPYVTSYPMDQSQRGAWSTTNDAVCSDVSRGMSSGSDIGRISLLSNTRNQKIRVSFINNSQKIWDLSSQGGYEPFIKTKGSGWRSTAIVADPANPQPAKVYPNQVYTVVVAVDTSDISTPFYPTPTTTAHPYALEIQMRESSQPFGAICGTPDNFVVYQQVVDSHAVCTAQIPSTWIAGETKMVPVTITNNGSSALSSLDLAIEGNNYPNAIRTSFIKVSSGSTIARLEPRGSTTLNLQVKAPRQAGTYRSNIYLLRRNYNLVPLTSCVSNELITVQDTPQSRNCLVSAPPIAPGETKKVSISLNNSGHAPWVGDGNWKLTPISSSGGLSFPKVGLYGKDTTGFAQIQEPISNYMFSFDITAPYTPGTFTSTWQMTKDDQPFGTTCQMNLAIAGTPIPRSTGTMPTRMPSPTPRPSLTPTTIPSPASQTIVSGKLYNRTGTIPAGKYIWMRICGPVPADPANCRDTFVQINSGAYTTYQFNRSVDNGKTYVMYISPHLYHTPSSVESQIFYRNYLTFTHMTCPEEYRGAQGLCTLHPATNQLSIDYAVSYAPAPTIANPSACSSQIVNTPNTCTCANADITRDCKIDIYDMVGIASCINDSTPACMPGKDVNHDGNVSTRDMDCLNYFYGQSCISNTIPTPTPIL